MLALGVAALATSVLAVLVARVRREVAPTRASFDRLARDLRPALIELRTDTVRTRAELARRLREQ
jgi:hypothetical protein